jgi:2-polyprenyl-3-methyl-5-hydroxy-6-metoxy-1,4-benzoquinol methylase
LFPSILIQVTCIKTDLNYPLPFKDNCFDFVISIETLEHLWSHFSFIKSVYKVLKRGGVFIFTTPNVLSIFSRISFLRSGRLSWFKESDFYTKQNYHISPLPIWQLKQTLKVMGLNFTWEIETFNRFYLRSLRIS